MGWVRHVIIDLVITLCVVLATFFAQGWAAWVVWIYTPAMVLLKIGAIGAKLPQAKDGPPDWFFHVLYAVNVVILLYHGWYWVAAGWVVIWVLSALAAARNRIPTKRG
jgi:hypothetical protein